MWEVYYANDSFYFLEPRSKMPRTREKSAYDKVKYRPMSPVESDSGHHLRSRKNINYMPPLSEDDSLLEEPVVKEYREPRSSSRLLAVCSGFFFSLIIIILFILETR